MANGSVRIDVDTSGASQNVKRLVDELNKLPKPLGAASLNISQLVSSAKDAGKSFATASKDSVALAKALGQVGTNAQTPREELKQLKQALEEATVAYNRLSDQEKAGEFGKALKQSIGDLTERAKSLKSSFAEVNRSLQDNKEKAKESGGALDFLEKKLGMSITSFTKFASVGGAVAGALKVAKDAFLQNESGIDEWGRTVEGAKGAYNTFLDTINGGNWSNFFTNLNDAITGARDLYDAIDRLGSVKANNQSAIAIAQAQIQKLRVLKQQGKDVDEQLKQAEANLKKLQGQQVEAGKNAGRKQIAEEIRGRYQSQQGAGTLSKGVLDYATKQIIEKGQSFFDAQKGVYERLQKKGTVTKTKRYTSSTGQTYETSSTAFDMKALSQDEQVKYRLAKAITEGETAIQQGIGMFSQAVNEEAQSYRDEFKANRYLKSGGSGGGNKKEEPVFDATANTLKGMRDNVTVLTKQLDTMKVGTEAYNKVLKDKIDWETKLKAQQQYNADLTTFYSGARAKPAKIDKGPEIDLFHQMSPDEVKKNSQIKLPKELTKPKKEKKDKGDGEQVKMIGEISDNISGMLSSLEAIGFEVPAEIRQVVEGINAVCTVVQTIQTIVMIIQALEALTAAKPLASGGIVHAASGTVMGKNYIDRVPATLSSGEMVMNEADQSSLWQAIKSGNFGGGSAQPYVKAEDIWLGLNNMFKRKGMGKVAFVKS
jgi:hypothetical protein